MLGWVAELTGCEIRGRWRSIVIIGCIADATSGERRTLSDNEMLGRIALTDRFISRQLVQLVACLAVQSICGIAGGAMRHRHLAIGADGSGAGLVERLARRASLALIVVRLFAGLALGFLLARRLALRAAPAVLTFSAGGAS